MGNVACVCCINAYQWTRVSQSILHIVSFVPHHICLRNIAPLMMLRGQTQGRQQPRMLIIDFQGEMAETRQSNYKNGKESMERKVTSKKSARSKKADEHAKRELRRHTWIEEGKRDTQGRNERRT